VQELAKDKISLPNSLACELFCLTDLSVPNMTLSVKEHSSCSTNATFKELNMAWHQNLSQQMNMILGASPPQLYVLVFVPIFVLPVVHQ